MCVYIYDIYMITGSYMARHFLFSKRPPQNSSLATVSHGTFSLVRDVTSPVHHPQRSLSLSLFQPIQAPSRVLKTCGGGEGGKEGRKGEEGGKKKEGDETTRITGEGGRERGAAGRRRSGGLR